MESGLGELDGASGVAYRDGDELGSFELSDNRRRHYIDVPLPGGQTGRKPGHITGSVQIRFDMLHSNELRDELRERVGRQRVTAPLVFDLALHDGTKLEGCSLGGCYGEWFDLHISEPPGPA